MIFNKMRVSPFLLQTNTFPNSQAENIAVITYYSGWMKSLIIDKQHIITR